MGQRRRERGHSARTGRALLNVACRALKLVSAVGDVGGRLKFVHALNHHRAAARSPSGGRLT